MDLVGGLACPPREHCHEQSFTLAPTSCQLSPLFTCPSPLVFICQIDVSQKCPLCELCWAEREEPSGDDRAESDVVHVASELCEMLDCHLLALSHLLTLLPWQ